MHQDTVIDNPYVQHELKPDEHLLWWGKPNPARRTKNNTLLYVNGILLGGLMIFTLIPIFVTWNLFNEEISFGMGPQSSTLLLLFFSIALFAFCAIRALLFYKQIQKNAANLRNTIYAITNQRIFAITIIGSNVAVKSHTRRDIGQIIRSETGDGWGDVSYGIPRTQQAGLRSVTVVDKLAGVPNARMVEDILIRTFKNDQQPSQPIWYSPQPQPYMPAAQPYPPQPQQYEAGFIPPAPQE